MRLLVFFGIMFWAWLSFGYAFGHDHARPELTPWFKSLTSKAKAACCDGSDATRLDGSDWEAAGKGYRVRVRGQWMDVPETAVVDGPNLSGDALVWLQTGYMGFGIRCFMPGSMT